MVYSSSLTDAEWEILEPLLQILAEETDELVIGSGKS